MVGKMLYDELSKRGYEVILISRNINKVKTTCPNAFDYIGWDQTEINKAVDGAFGVINLAGAPIAGHKWTQEYKKTLTDSRINTTKQLVLSIQKSIKKPAVLINASAVGYYGIRETKKSFEEQDEAGSDFLAALSESWENEAKGAKINNVRVVTIRSAVILDSKEGALPQILRPFKYLIGGPIGNGKQPFPWIHIKDEIGIIIFALLNVKVNGPINASSPQQINNRHFAKTLGKIVNKPCIFPLPPFVLQLIYGEGAQVLTTGVNVSSKRIEKFGYKFKYRDVLTALEDLLK